MSIWLEPAAAAAARAEEVAKADAPPLLLTPLAAPAADALGPETERGVAVPEAGMLVGAGVLAAALTTALSSVSSLCSGGHVRSA